MDDQPDPLDSMTPAQRAAAIALGKALTEFGQLLANEVRANGGQIQLFPIFLDANVTPVRIEALIDELVELKVVDDSRLADRIRAKFEARIEMLKAPRIAIATPGGGKRN